MAGVKPREWHSGLRAELHEVGSAGKVDLLGLARGAFIPKTRIIVKDVVKLPQEWRYFFEHEATGREASIFLRENGIHEAISFGKSQEKEGKPLLTLGKGLEFVLMVQKTFLQERRQRQ
jgi:hypothetical protein